MWAIYALGLTLPDTSENRTAEPLCSPFVRPHLSHERLGSGAGRGIPRAASTMRRARIPQIPMKNGSIEEI
ncbi:hypothetical protein PJE062_2436 [Pseudovibrio sp. JE062]|nr:hypothetical protein PJE062_2436 [Pseudovibrio sp. JE062]